MKNAKKIVSMLLVAMMALGMCVTAFAAGNESPGVSDPVKDTPFETKVQAVMETMTSSATVAAGKGTISKITDKNILASAFDQAFAVYDYTYEVDKQLKDGVVCDVMRELLFDVSGVESGEVTIKLQDEGDFKASAYVGKLVVVSHFNTKTNKWEIMSKLAEIDKDGCLTISFSSYSPIMLSILDVTAADLKPGATLGVQKTTYTPQQVAAKSPKMGE